MTPATTDDGPEVIWEPQCREDGRPGPQWALLRCPVEDVLFGGARGGGKTDGVLGDWMAYVDRHGAAGAGRQMNGILFRRTYTELEQVERRARELFHAHGARYAAGRREWRWRNGATFKFRYLETVDDASHYQGHSYCYMAFEELTDWPLPDPVDLVRGSLRSAYGLPCLVRNTANPGGSGHNWVKARYIAPAPPMVPHYDADAQTWRVFIPSLLDDNVILRRNDPDYERRIYAATAGNTALREAWRFGEWDILAGGFFDDLWRTRDHVLPPFTVPRDWWLDRSFDWGYSAPFSVGWWAESDGDTPAIIDGRPRYFARGTLIRVAEWYGVGSKPNEGIRLPSRDIARGILERERQWGWENRVHTGVADSAIFTEEDGRCIAREMEEEGVAWLPSVKKRGSRIHGWQAMREMLHAARTCPRERAGLFVVDTCRDFIRTVPYLTRDKKNAEDIDTNSEDHVADETRYRISRGGSRVELVEVHGY